MNPNEQSDDLPLPANHIGDQNVERLLTTVYQPEPLDADFVNRVRQRAEAEVVRQQSVHRATPPVNENTAARRTPWWGIGAAALMLLIVAGFLATRGVRRQPGYYVDGELVWIDGRAFRPADQNSPRTDAAPDIASAGHSQRPAATLTTALRRVGSGGLTPRERPVVAGAHAASVGDSIVTERGERRRVELPDGSILYVNELATVQVRDVRRIVVDAGEVFVDVSPAAEHGGAKFVAQTPRRDVTAVGTKFGVNVTRLGTDVAVAEGRVNISGLESPLLAGQQFGGQQFGGQQFGGQQFHRQDDGTGAEPAVTPLPRASHVLHWTRDLMAAAESPLVPGSKYRGGALVAIDPNGQQAKLSLRKYHVDVHLEDGFARTTIDQTYFNDLNSRLEGTFYFPLPADASISRLAMYVNGKLMEGGMAERDHARNVFETIKHRSLDPALLEWVDGSTFKMRVFPLEGRQEKRIVLSYTQRLGSNYGRTDYRFPAGHDMDVVRDWSVRLHVAGGERLRWECTSHELQEVTAGGNLTLTDEATDVAPDRDVVLTLFDDDDDTSDDASGNGQALGHARLSAFTHDGARYTMLRFTPELQAVMRRPRRDWVFLFDADGSRDPLLARVQVDIIRNLLENAEHGDTFAVITAATRVHTLAQRPWPVTDENIAAAVQLLDQTQLIGALDLNKALEACREVARTLEDPVVVHVGSAIPILGEHASERLVDQLPPRASYVGVGVGHRWNRQFMKAAASRTGGYFTQINPDEVVGWRAFELLATLNSPRLLDLHVEADDEEASFFTFNDSAVDGEEVCAIIRQEAGDTKIKAVTVTGSLDGAPFRQAIPVEQVQEDAAYLPRIWAKLAIDDMVARGAEAHKAEIIELSKAMYVMSPFTSLLVLENDAMHQQYNVDRGRKDHWALYPCPVEIDVVHEPMLGPEPPGTQETPETPDAANEQPPKPSREEVLKTLLVRWSASDNSLQSERGFGVAGRHDVAVPVFVPDGRTVLLGGIKQINRRQFSLDAVYLNGFRTSEPPNSLMLMVTPRIIIQEEEIALWDIDRDVDGVMDFDTNGNGRAALADFESLIELISGTITPETWEAVGGPGSIEAFPTNLSLVVRQSQEVQFQNALTLETLANRVYPVGDLVVPVISGGNALFPLLQLRTTPSDPFGEDPFGGELNSRIPSRQDWSAFTADGGLRYVSPDVTGQLLAVGDASVLAKLEKQTDFNYVGQPLQEVIDDIARRHDLAIIIDSEAFDDSGIDTDTRVTLAVDGLQLKSGLVSLTRSQGLTYFVADGVLHISTPEGTNRNLLSRAAWYQEKLLLIPRQLSTVGTRRVPRLRHIVPRRPNDPRLVDHIARSFRSRREQHAEHPSLLYPAEVGLDDHRDSLHLAGYARGIATTRADVLAVLEQEADLEPWPQTGTVDDEAKALIDAARRDGWQRVTCRDDAGRDLWAVTVDGQGRFRLEQTTDFGLAETVVSDGETLWHLYPELGLGTERQQSRFHRAELTSLVPWLVPPVEDLLVGADVRAIGPRTIAIAPHGVDDARDDQTDDQDESRLYHRVHLLFSATGRLAERHLVEMPSGQTVMRIVYDEDGKTRWFDADDTPQDEVTLSVEPVAAPDLKPRLADLVVLPMPIRTRDYVYQTAARPAAGHTASDQNRDALLTIATDDDGRRKQDPVNWSEPDVLRLLGAIAGQDIEEIRNVIGRRFFARGDRRLGFYTLLAATGTRWDVDEPIQLNDGTSTRMSPLADHPRSPLAHYLEQQLRTTPAANWDEATLDAEVPNHFISQLLEFEQLCLQWHPAKPLAADAETRHRETEHAFDFIERCDSPQFAFTLLRRLQRQFGNDQPHHRIAAALLALETRGMTSYIIKYELARSLAAHGQQAQARQLFMELFRDSLAAGVLPLVDQTFRDALQQRDGPFWSSEDSGKDFGGFVRGACADLIQRDRRRAAIALAWQCRQLDDTKLAGQLIDLVLTGIPEQQRLETSLAALDYLVQIGDHQRTISLLQPLLATEPYAQSTELWRLAAQVAHDAGMLARSIDSLERAAELEYAALPESYQVEQVRKTYGELIARYQELAKIVASDARDASPLDLVSRVIQAADRWRSLETDVNAACQQAARLLNTLGQHDLAWDYLTTPLANKPNESTAWLSLAHTLRDEESVDLADRAYRMAWQAEPTNASILWEHAQLLELAGRLEEARKLYQQIVAGDWQPRFRPIQGRAQRIMAAATEQPK